MLSEGGDVIITNHLMTGIMTSVITRSGIKYKGCLLYTSVSRKDEVGGETVTTFDIRMKEPNREPALGQGALHTIEHLAATYPVSYTHLIHLGACRYLASQPLQET